MTTQSNRRYTLADRLLMEADKALRTISGADQAVTRPSPAQNLDSDPLSEQDRQHAAGLMRVNHTGEVCAQALYQGQALTAELESVREEMDHAAKEEIDHLQWCDKRLQMINFFLGGVIHFFTNTLQFGGESLALIKCLRANLACMIHPH